MKKFSGDKQPKRKVKKMWKVSNNKGFSLIELLIVFAIMAVMGLIAFNIFGGMVENSRVRADEQQAQNIEKVLTTYMVDSGDYTLEKIYTTSAAAIAGTGAVDTNNGTATNNFIKVLQDVIYTTTANGDLKQYGPLLTPPAGHNPDFDNFKPQYKSYNGYNIHVYTDKKNVKVTPSASNVFVK